MVLVNSMGKLEHRTIIWRTEVRNNENKKTHIPRR